MRACTAHLVVHSSILNALAFTHARPPGAQVRDFVYISDKAYTRDQILECEKVMLNTLGFHLTVPTPFQFLTRLTKAANGDKPLSHLAQYYMELALPEYSLLHFKGSMIAAAALYCAIRVMRDTRQGSPDGWTYALARHRCVLHHESAVWPDGRLQF